MPNRHCLPFVRAALQVTWVLSILVWPRGLAPNALNLVPWILVAVSMLGLAFVAARFLDIPRGAGRSYDGYALLGCDVALVVMATGTAVLLEVRNPRDQANVPPTSAVLGRFGILYDPCERGNRRVVCSDVRESSAYVCEGGFTVRVVRCLDARGLCAHPKGSDDGALDEGENLICGSSP